MANKDFFNVEIPYYLLDTGHIHNRLKNELNSLSDELTLGLTKRVSTFLKTMYKKNLAKLSRKIEQKFCQGQTTLKVEEERVREIVLEEVLSYKRKLLGTILLDKEKVDQKLESLINQIEIEFIDQLYTNIEKKRSFMNTTSCKEERTKQKRLQKQKSYNTELNENELIDELDFDDFNDDEVVKDFNDLGLNDKNMVLVEQYLTTEDEDSLNQLIELNRGLVLKYAHIYNNYFNHKLELQDLVQAGSEGLIEGVKRFDLSRNVFFSTYVTYWIRRFIYRELCNNGFTIRVPMNIMNSFLKLRKYEREYLKNNQELNINEIINDMGITLKKYHELKYYEEFILNTVSIYTPIGADSKSSIIDLVADQDESRNSLSLIINDELKTTINDVLETLSIREEQVLRLRFGLDGHDMRTLEEIGKMFGVTKERIRQIEERALRKLRHPSRRKTLQEFYESM